MSTARGSSIPRDFLGGVVALAGAAIATRIVRVFGGVVNVLLVTEAKADTFSNQFGPLYYLDGAMDGGTVAALGEAVLVSTKRVVTTATVCTDPVVVGQPIYLTDTGNVDNVAGSVPRRVGTVLTTIDPGARTVTWLFDGEPASKHLVEESTGLKLLTGLNLAYGQLQLNVREETIADGNIAPYPEVAQTDSIVAILRSAVAGAARHINMPTTPLVGQVVMLKDADASAAASNIVIHGNGYQLDGDPDVTWNTNGTWGILVFSGTRWLRMS